MTAHSSPFDDNPLVPRRRLHDEAKFDITAMIDLVFMMNIFFLVTTVTAALAEIDLPAARHCAPADRDTSIVFTIMAGPDRGHGFLSRTGSLALLYKLWIGHTAAVTVGVEGNHHSDLHAPELALRLGWELSNGRRLADHTAVEGENYFYPQRGPGRETGRLTVGP